MANYPTLASGSVAQYPHRRQWSIRTVENQYQDGRDSWYTDPASERRTWTLSYKSLTQAERDALAGFFESCKGRWQTFTFCEPDANLFNSSDDLTAAAWPNPAQVSVQAGIDDPFGGTKAFRIVNASQATAVFGQTVAIGAGNLCVSAWVRDSAGGAVSLQIGGPVPEQQPGEAGPGWRRIWASAAASGAVTAGLLLQPGQSVDVYGFQAEAQQAPSAYKPTVGAGGVYSNARFDQDELKFVETEMGQFATEVKIVAGVTE